MPDDNTPSNDPNWPPPEWAGAIPNDLQSRTKRRIEYAEHPEQPVRPGAWEPVDAEDARFAEPTVGHLTQLAVDHATDPYRTRLSPEQEQEYQRWTKVADVPVPGDAPRQPYDLRGYWQALRRGDIAPPPAGQGHDLPPTFATPFSSTFDARSRYHPQYVPAGPTAAVSGAPHVTGLHEPRRQAPVPRAGLDSVTWDPGPEPGGARVGNEEVAKEHQAYSEGATAQDRAGTRAWDEWRYKTTDQHEGPHWNPRPHATMYDDATRAKPYSSGATDADRRGSGMPARGQYDLKVSQPQPINAQYGLDVSDPRPGADYDLDVGQPQAASAFDQRIGQPVGRR